MENYQYHSDYGIITSYLLQILVKDFFIFLSFLFAFDLLTLYKKSNDAESLPTNFLLLLHQAMNSFLIYLFFVVYTKFYKIWHIQTIQLVFSIFFFEESNRTNRTNRHQTTKPQLQISYIIHDTQYTIHNTINICVQCQYNFHSALSHFKIITIQLINWNHT